MSAGTITLTNNSATVTGSGTTFTSDLKIGDFVTATVGGTLYSLIVSAIASNTSLTLNLAYTGPTTGSLSWAAVPAQTMASITAQLVVESTKALRGLNFDKANWQQIFTGTGNVTVTMPDLTVFSGPSWRSITTSLAAKADIVNGVVPVSQGGLGTSDMSTARNNLGITSSRIGTNSAIIKIGDILHQSGVALPTTPIGAFNTQVLNGITYYTHFYKITLPTAFPNVMISCGVSTGGALFGSQAPEYTADVKVRRDNDGGTAISNSTITVSVKTQTTGWTPVFYFWAYGY